MSRIRSDVIDWPSVILNDKAVVQAVASMDEYKRPFNLPAVPGQPLR